MLPLVVMYDDPISAKYAYLHPESQNFLQKNNSHVTSIFSFLFFGPTRKSDIKMSITFKPWKMVRAHKRWSWFHFLSLFILILNTDQLNIWEYDKYVPKILSCRICSKPFLFTFYHPITFIFRGSSNYFTWTESTSSSSSTTTIAVSTAFIPLSFSSRTYMMV